MEDRERYVEELFLALDTLRRDTLASPSESRRTRMAEALVSGLAALKLPPAEEDILLVALRERLVKAAERDYRDAEEHRRAKSAPAASNPELGRLRADITHVSQERDALKLALDAEKAHGKQLETSLASLRPDIDQLQAGREAAQRRHDQDQAALNAARMRWQSTEDERILAVSERDAIKSALERAETTNAAARQRMATLERELEELRSRPVISAPIGPSPFCERLRGAMLQSLDSILETPSDQGLSEDDRALILTCGVLVRSAIDHQVSIDELFRAIKYGTGASIADLGFGRMKTHLEACLGNEPDAVAKLRTALNRTIALSGDLVDAHTEAIKRGAPRVLEDLGPEGFPVTGFMRNYRDSWEKLQNRRSELLQEDLYALYFEEPLREAVTRISPY